MMLTVHKGVEIWLDLREHSGGMWSGECTFKDPFGIMQEFVPVRERFPTRDRARTSAIEEVMRFIDGHTYLVRRVKSHSAF